MLRPTLLLPGILSLLCLAAAPAQESLDFEALFPPPPGFVLVDDEWLPADAVWGDSVYTPDPWPGGVVPYRLSIFILPAQQELFREYVKDIECVCGIRFIEDVNNTSNDHIIVVPSSDPGVSSSAVGYQGGSQALRIWPGSANPNDPASHWPQKYVVIHELFHALGYRHEQSRPDRNLFVTINWNNIPSNRQHNFDILTVFAMPTTVGVYDFDSIMHYGSCAFTSCLIGCGPALPGCYTITTNDPMNQSRIGNRAYMSLGDIQGLQHLYGQTTSFPDITGINPVVVPYNQQTTVTITGENFYQGSTVPGSGAPGSYVKIDGVDLRNETTYVDRNTLTVNVPAWMTLTNPCLSVTVYNEYFGDSMPAQLGVAPSSVTNDLFAGSAADANAGYAVVGLGDVDGDGRDDVAIGMPNESLLGLTSSGRVECRSGADGSVIWSQVFGTERRAGASLAAADFNGDGILDLIVGAPSFLPYMGRVYVVDGRNGSQIVSAPGVQGDDAFGSSVANATDLTGDGIPEFVVGIPRINQVRVIDGSNGSTHFILNGPTASSFGLSVGGGQDMNGNGTADIAVGAPANNSGQGQVTVYDGLTQSLLLTVSGGGQGGALGAAVALVPSVTRRAGGTLLCGAPSWSGFRGRVQVWDSLTGGSYPLLATLEGDAADDFFGRSLAAAGDLDQDGYHDFIVGAPQGAGNSGAGPGWVRVFDGRTRTALATFTGGQPAGGFGWSVGAAGDTNGDGLADVLAGAPFADPGCRDSGLVQVLRPRVGPTQRAPRLSEVRWADHQGVEITNHDGVAVDMARWRVRWLQGATRFESLPLPPYVLQPGHSLVVGDFVSALGIPPFPEVPPNVRYFPVLPAIPAGADGIVVGLVTPGGVVLDEVRIGPAAGGSSAAGDTGGLFRGRLDRAFPAGQPGCERVWGLDSNGGADWTLQNVTSMGLENRSSGPRGFDPVPVPAVVINEIDDQPDYVEFRNVSGGTVDLEGWFLLVKASPSGSHVPVRPWRTPTPIPDGGYYVIGEGPPPAEMMATTPYVGLTGGPAGAPPLRFGIDPIEVALYDLKGRLVDLVRIQRFESHMVHNHPRAPSPWAAFGGGAYRLSGTGGACGRDASSTDTNAGADWRPIHVRTMGAPNAPSTWAGGPGHGHPYDVRLSEGVGDGLTLIINAGSARAGDTWSFLISVAPTLGTGPFFGLGQDALFNWFNVSTVPPWFGQLDANGSARLDVPAGGVPSGIHTEDIFLLQAPSGPVVFMTKVIPYDT